MMNIKEKYDATIKIIRMMPIPVLLSTIENIVKILHDRGVDIIDWDNKDKKIVQLRMIGGKAYFFAASDSKESDKNGREE